MTAVTSTKFNQHTGGLDHAVKYAQEKRLYEKYAIIDLDAHERLPFSNFIPYLPEPWKNVISAAELQRREDEYLASLKEEFANDPMNRWRLDNDNFRDDPIVKERIREVTTPNYILQYAKGGVTDEWGHRRVRGDLRPDTDLDSDHDIANTYFAKMKEMGIKRTTVLPGNIVFGASLDPRPEVEVVCCQAYMDFVLDKFLGKYDEFIGVVPVPVRTPERAVDLIDKVANQKGVDALFLLSTYEVNAGDELYFPIYEVAQEKRIPIIFHGDTDTTGFFSSFKTYLSAYALSFPLSIAKQLTGITFEGIFERFPHLKFAFIEAGVTWLPWLMHRLDITYLEKRKDAPLLNKLPSEYIAEKCYIGTQPLETMPYPRRLKWAFDFFRERKMMDKIVYCSDYPHSDWDAPSSVHSLGYLTDQEKHMMFRDNALKFLERS